ncbi:MAG: hypothetical protein NXI27_20430 [Alphaproteobacteria bacterium]|nr:hypothetical protein [Alphaproteobacteria bacterium]
MRWLLIPAVLFASVSHAQERRLTGDEIATLLPDIIAIGETTRQTFESGGHTDFDDGRRRAVGRWRIQNDSYCSTWPPGNSWRCYHVLLDDRDDEPDLIIWIDTELGDRTVNTILPKGQ